MCIARIILAGRCKANIPEYSALDSVVLEYQNIFGNIFKGLGKWELFQDIY